ncbi:MAG: MBL fold metallo-hydrolase, partial [Clostridia bacterium]|nr:MBL fold metallo-hydrolase [Clostridia bacterium]
MKRKRFLYIVALLLLLFAVFASAETVNDGNGGDFVTKLLYQGHGSFRLTSGDGTVVYVDPYAGEGYDAPADIILVTHQHGDHNQLELPARKDNCVVITEAEALEGGTHRTFDVKGIRIEAVEASNKNHDPKLCVGFIITIDGVVVYAAGDTSQTGQMEAFAERGFDYALLPCDGVYNMDLDEAAACAELIRAKHNIPIHMKPGALFDRERAEAFAGSNRLI